MFSWNYNSFDQIEPGKDGRGAVYLGNYEAAKNVDMIAKNHITAVLSAVPQIIATVPEYARLGVQQKIIDCQDCPTFDMSPFLEAAADFII